jgi:hypothetical protein
LPRQNTRAKAENADKTWIGLDMVGLIRRSHAAGARKSIKNQNGMARMSDRKAASPWVYFRETNLV